MTDREFLDHRLGQIEAKLDRIHVLITGNGEPEKGISYRLAACESFNKSVKRGAWAAVTGFLSAAGGLVWALFGKH